MARAKSDATPKSDPAIWPPPGSTRDEDGRLIGPAGDVLDEGPGGER